MHGPLAVLVTIASVCIRLRSMRLLDKRQGPVNRVLCSSGVAVLSLTRSSIRRHFTAWALWAAYVVRSFVTARFQQQNQKIQVLVSHPLLFYSFCAALSLLCSRSFE